MADTAVHGAELEALKWARQQGETEEQLRKAAQFNQFEIEGRQMGILTQGQTLIDLEKYLAAPYRITESKTFIDANSFAEYVRKFDTGNMVVFGSIGSSSVLALIDYHGMDSTSWVTHHATLKSACTPEWAALKKANGIWFKQEPFAEFLEEWSHIFVTPDCAHILEVAMNLSGSMNGSFESRINRSNGNVVLSYSEETVTNQVRVPDSLIVEAAPFFHTEPEQMKVLLRFRIQDRKPVFAIVIPDIARREMLATEALFASVGSKISQSVLITP